MTLFQVAYAIKYPLVLCVSIALLAVSPMVKVLKFDLTVPVNATEPKLSPFIYALAVKAC